ncbi:hypothetical protein PLESTB_000182800 [Pleodorina starrii]|uniref:Uncharacterized protein n=1 Tax=Pleodorina starrii TaxID=330485 RepID=A0A9W6BCA1_9CHLO|nr:hypothetical protein PLESTM_000513900 [Pleodorina starrii]GLC49103.1 hypothetical protein PLESTB_000182800 [Pleodorina starrii]GLC66102.1 hypothetical protein PLESTF_000384900 [Pleodorina starrii]
MVRYNGGPGGERKSVEGVMRTSKMYEEAEDFARRMSEYARHLQTFQHATTDFISSVTPMMSVPLPRVWDHLPDGGLAEPVRARVSHDYPSELLGADVDINGIRAAVLEMERRLVTGISRPLSQWRDALETARQRLPEVERLRRELAREQGGLDRTVSKAERRHRREVGLDQPHGVAGLLFRRVTCTHPRVTSPGRGQRATGGQVAAADAAEPGPVEQDVAAGGAGGGGTGGGRGFREEFRVEERNMKTVYMARRREAILKSFTEQEGLLNEQLSGLCRDASWLKSYMIASLVATKEGMQASSSSSGGMMGGGRQAGDRGDAVTHYLGSTKQPVPGHSEGVPTSLRGTVGPNPELIRRFLIDRTSRMEALERMRGRMGREGLHAHRAIASPMELHARGDMRGKELIEPVRRGAAGQPLGAAVEPEAESPAGPDTAAAAVAAGAPSSTAATEKLAVVGGQVLPV